LDEKRPLEIVQRLKNKQDTISVQDASVDFASFHSVWVGSSDIRGLPNGWS